MPSARVYSLLNRLYFKVDIPLFKLNKIVENTSLINTSNINSIKIYFNNEECILSYKNYSWIIIPLFILKNKIDNNLIKITKIKNFKIYDMIINNVYLHNYLNIHVKKFMNILMISGNLFLTKTFNGQILVI